MQVTIDYFNFLQRHCRDTQISQSRLTLALSPFAYMWVYCVQYVANFPHFPWLMLLCLFIIIHVSNTKKVRVFVSTKMCSSQHCQQALPHITSKKVSIPIHMMLFPCTQFLQGIHIVKNTSYNCKRCMVGCLWSIFFWHRTLQKSKCIIPSFLSPFLCNLIYYPTILYVLWNKQESSLYATFISLSLKIWNRLSPLSVV